ncbi:MAG: ECF transporter S component [Pseudobutyrivibrio sp.]|nr:ECF transporter S component [Pseudobutyrivibrio sp.]
MQSNKSRTYDLVLTGLFIAIIVVLANTPLGYIPLGVINATTIHIPVIIGAIFLGPKKGGLLGGVFGLTSFIKSTTAPTVSAFVFSPIVAVSTLNPQTAGATILVVLKSLFIAFVPRILIGVVAYYVFAAVRKLVASENKKVSGLVVNVVVSIVIGFGLYMFMSKKFAGLSFALTVVIATLIAVVIFALMQYMLTKKDARALSFVSAGIAGSMTNTILVMGSIYVLYAAQYAEAVGVAGDALLGVIMGIVTFNGVVEAIVAGFLTYAIGAVLDKIKPAGEYATKAVTNKSTAA